ncbi:TIGR02679 family protein [Clostridium manihotivorum]|uniref:TIGR02679 family protein n=1 Tax=Clostridium manihotivorum TaxID=2320868 RepID=A0A3R5UH35_9CLOT|nr:TIGR02679 family protein [Clostridium manihotivorum]QAA33567.1 TIGR02679 family protein [Clostridium manihotivorum]
MQGEETLTQQCISYFKSNAGYKRIFQRIREKYESLGSLGGTVVLTNLKEEEKEVLTGLFRKDYNKKNCSFKVENFIKALDNTRFEGVNFQMVFEGYFGEKILYKKEEKTIYEKEKTAFLKDIINSLRGTRGEGWLEYIVQTKENPYRIISQRYDENKERLRANLLLVCHGFNNLSFEENKLVRLAVFSSAINRDPHGFDINTDIGTLLIYAIIYKLKMSYPENAEELNEVLYKAGIIRDEVSNFTLCSGLTAYKGDKEHMGWRGFYEDCEPLQVSLWNLSKLDKIKSPLGKVYVFENPTVFSEVLYYTSEIRPSLVCTFGQFKLASLILLDKLVDSGATIYYSGDFDPEGLSMADKLKQRYAHKAILWRYEAEDYLKIQSDVALSPARLKKLDKLKSKELQAISTIIKEKKNGAYQELLIDEYIRDIKSH